MDVKKDGLSEGAYRQPASPFESQHQRLMALVERQTGEPTTGIRAEDLFQERYWGPGVPFSAIGGMIGAAAAGVAFADTRIEPFYVLIAMCVVALVVATFGGLLAIAVGVLLRRKSARIAAAAPAEALSGHYSKRFNWHELNRPFHALERVARLAEAVASAGPAVAASLRELARKLCDHFEAYNRLVDRLYSTIDISVGGNPSQRDLALQEAHELCAVLDAYADRLERIEAYILDESTKMSPARFLEHVTVEYQRLPALPSAVRPPPTRVRVAAIAEGGAVPLTDTAEGAGRAAAERVSGR